VDATTNPPTVNVDVDPLKKTGKNHTVHWIIDNDTGQNFQFPATGGILFYDGDGGKSEFNCALDTTNDPNNQTFTCFDPKGAKCSMQDGKPDPCKLGYKYDITVNDPSTAITAHTNDPRIINN
jgi:hypothetical protein